MAEKNRIQGMVRSIDQYRNGQPKAVAAGSPAQILYALEDSRHDLIVLWDFAVATGERNAKLLELAEDAVPILEAVLDDREEANGEEDEILRDLLNRFRASINAKDADHG